MTEKLNMATIVYQLTEDQLNDLAHRIVEETKESVSNNIYDRISLAMGDKLAYCSMEEACNLAHVTRQTISSWVKQGRLHPVYNGNRMLFLRTEVKEQERRGKDQA